MYIRSYHNDHGPEGEVVVLVGERAERLGEELGEHVQPLLHQVGATGFCFDVVVVVGWD